MRKTFVFLALVVVFTAVPAAAQEAPAGNLAQVVSFVVADAEAFEAGLEAHNQYHAGLNDPMAIQTFQIITGPRGGEYLRGSFGRTWASFDAEMASLAADAADTAQNLDPHVTRSEVTIYEVQPEISRFPEGGIRPLSKLIEFRLEWGREGAFRDAIDKIHAALSEVEDFRPYIWYRLVDGGHVPTFVVSLPSENWAGFAPPAQGIAAIVGAKYGEEAAAIFEAMGSAIESETAYTIAYRDDLSYLPAATAEPAE